MSALYLLSFVCSGSSLIPAARAAEPAQPAKTAISDEAKEAVQRMGKTLAAEDVSVKARTIRVYLDDKGQPLHIFHTMDDRHAPAGPARGQGNRRSRIGRNVL